MLSEKQLTNIKTIRVRIAKEHQRPAGYRPNLTCVARAEKVIATIVANEPDRQALDACSAIHELLGDVLSLVQSPWTAKSLLTVFKAHNMISSQMVIVSYIATNSRQFFGGRNKSSLEVIESACLPETLAMLRIIQ